MSNGASRRIFALAIGNDRMYLLMMSQVSSFVTAMNPLKDCADFLFKIEFRWKCKCAYESRSENN